MTASCGKTPVEQHVTTPAEKHDVASRVVARIAVAMMTIDCHLTTSVLARADDRVERLGRTSTGLYRVARLPHPRLVAIDEPNRLALDVTERTPGMRCDRRGLPTAAFAELHVRFLH
jgi:hypothetical protein